MMGRQHALTGVIAGGIVASAVNLLSDTTPVLHASIVLTMGGASLLPDLDTPQSTAARSLGFLTKSLAKSVDTLSLWVYHGTRTDRDVADRKSGHRLLTHTAPGWLFFAAVVGIACVSHPVAGAVVLGLLSGLLALGLKKYRYGLLLSIIGGAAGYYLLSSDYFAWWWLLSACVFVGSFIHTMGDWLTNSGAPITYPLVVNGKRWYLSKSPATFPAGGPVETVIIYPALLIATATTVVIYATTYYLEKIWML